MIQLEKLVDALKKREFGPVMGVPCSVFKDFLNYIIDNESFEHYVCSSEGESMGVAAGFSLGGKLPIVYMQNDGYGNAVNPLSSLQLMYELPTLMLLSWRGEPGKKDAYQHLLMGETLTKLLELFKIPYEILDEDGFEKSIANAADYIKFNKKPYALIVKKGLIEKYKIDAEKQEFPLRSDYLVKLSEYAQESDIFLGTTGFTGRELHQIVDVKSKFYMMGSMGCLPAIGLGLSKSFDDRRIFVLDGDGALLMKMGTLSTIGFYKPENLIHICFDNNKYESTGCQPTTASTTDFRVAAEACGYQTSIYVDTMEEFSGVIDNLSEMKMPVFIHVRTSAGSIDNLKRPSETPVEMRDNFMEAIDVEI